MAVHSSPYPNAAPAIEYVEIPDGSSSAQPVINPGPKSERKALSGLCLDFSLGDRMSFASRKQ